MNAADAALLRWSVVVVWLATAVVSLVAYSGQSMALLTGAGIHDPRLAGTLIISGALADLVVGIALAVWPGRATYCTALALMGVMTLIATVLDPALWLHPLGPLTKNIPIAAALWVLIRSQR